ncbi:MAG: formylglycine-generating enzyme family protein [Chloroflexi bacterium]|nr:formylglycine-generating enzyme family protein [Chloroflexota bacterium]
MYPLGESHPHGLVDMGGNVWEWQANYYRGTSTLALRGGSWGNSLAHVRVSARRGVSSPSYSSGNYGFRVLLVPSMVLRETPD